jgi:heat-inducible transcriptional repressor
MDDLSERGKQVLEAIIEDYIDTAEPVGSRTISRKRGFGLSPASVRNVMADLEEMGFLASPHTSAGRVPTDKAYRFYVDSLLEVSNLDGVSKEILERRCAVTGSDVAELLKQTSRTLSFLSSYTGIVLAPHFNQTTFRHIDFIKLGGKRVLAILVGQNGLVQNKLVETTEELASDDLVRMTNYLNELLKGLPIINVKARILEEMRKEKVLYDSLLAKALELSEKAVSNAGEDTDFFLEGQANILDQPEFADISKMRDIFRAFEEKGQLIGLLDRCLSAEGIHIFIGSECQPSHVEGMSLITSTYRSGSNLLGVLGVIGPTRMGYAKVIPMVDYTAKLLSRLLEDH